MTLEILICTLDDGINNIPALLLEPREGISYLVSWQHGDNKDIELPKELKRDDVKICDLEGRGLSRNRNNCLRHASGDILLIADDDCKYAPEQLDAIIEIFDRNPSLSLATFRMASEHNNKTYPNHEFSLAKPPKGYYVSSIEIALRRAKAGHLQFDERFGLGAPVFQCCEEELFVEQAVEDGLVCRFFPITVVRHDDATTQITRAVAPNVLAARGAYLWLSPRYHSTALLRAVVMAWRMRKHGITFGHAFRHIYHGITLIRKQQDNKK